MSTTLMKRLLLGLERRGFYHCLPDKMYVKIMFYAMMGKKLNLRDPQTFNEKLQWLKLYDRDSVHTELVDKYRVRKFVAKAIGEEYLIPLLGVWEDPEKIDFDALPERFVLKCNHNSGLGMCICKDKSKLDLQKVKEGLAKGLKQNYYLSGREWPYKNVKPLIVAEQFMSDDGNESSEAGLTDYKFFCFDGCVDCVMVCVDRHLNDTKFYFFDQDWNLKRLNLRGKAAPADFTLPKPECMDEMFRIASKLSEGFPFLRVDLYACGGKIYFGEMTFFPDSGFDGNLLEETDQYFGSLIDLKKIREKK